MIPRQEIIAVTAAHEHNSLLLPGQMKWIVAAMNQYAKEKVDEALAKKESDDKATREVERPY